MTSSADWMPDRWLVDDADGRPVLLGGWSPSSGLYHFPPSPVCPYRGVDDVEVVQLSRTGRLWAWTAVTAAPPGYDGPVPFGFGVVELAAEGLRIIGRLTEPDPGELVYGQEMELTVEQLPGERRMWAFRPVVASPAAGGERRESAS
jgi:uncharacterized OB-fold protein